MMMMMMVEVLEGELALMVRQPILSWSGSQGCHSGLQASHPNFCDDTELMSTASKPSLPPYF